MPDEYFFRGQPIAEVWTQNVIEKIRCFYVRTKIVGDVSLIGGYLFEIGVPKELQQKTSAKV